MDLQFNKPTAAFIGVSWLALFAGVIAYFVGLWNAEMLLNEKGYYFILMLFGLFSAVSLQKVVRDKLENIAVTHIYYALCWASLLISMLLLAVGLWNANLLLSEKGFYAMSFILSLFGAVAVQKNIRDIEFFNQHTQQHLPSYTPPLSTPDLEAIALEQDDTKSTHTP